MENREILFRGITASEPHKFVFGSLLQDYAGTCQIWEKDTDGSLHNYIVIPETIGQFTGLYKKSGERVFEGDIVKHWHFSVGDTNLAIIFDGGKFCFDVKPYQFGEHFENTLPSYCGLEIIGTIHDHLLKGYQWNS